MRSVNPRLLLLILVLFTITLSLKSLSLGFLIDDLEIVNTMTQEGRASPRTILMAGEQIRHLPLPYYRPVTNLSYLLDTYLWGEQAFGFHLTNLLLNLGNTLLVFQLTLEVVRTPLAAWAGALLFAAHPIHTEAVDMIQGRTDLLATFFYLIAFLLFRHSLDSRGTPKAPYLHTASLASFFLALLSKEMAITLPLIILLYGYCRPKEPHRKPLLWILPYFATILLYLGLRLSLLGLGQLLPRSELLTPHHSPALAGRLLQLPLLLTTYLKLLLWPYPLRFRFFGAFPGPKEIADPAFFLPLLLLSLLLGAVLLIWQKSKEVGLSVGWVLLTLLPVLGFTPIPGFIMAERYLYLPSVGYALLFTLLLGHLLREPGSQGKQILIGGALTGLLIVFTGLTIHRHAEWTDQLAIWQAIAREAPENSAVHNNLGVEYLHRDRFEEAIVHFQKAAEINPRNISALNNLGLAYARSGKVEAAEKAYRQALHLDPGHLRARWNLAELLERTGRWKEAEQEYLLGLQYHPKAISLWQRFRGFYERTGEVEKAQRITELLHRLQSSVE
jgi:tetratricopeptide (TPR) repeat protein